MLCFALVLKCVFRDFLNWLVTRKIFLYLLISVTPWLSCYSLLFGMQPNELLLAIVQLMINVSAFRNGGREPVIVKSYKRHFSRLCMQPYRKLFTLLSPSLDPCLLFFYLQAENWKLFCCFTLFFEGFITSSVASICATTSQICLLKIKILFFQQTQIKREGSFFLNIFLSPSFRFWLQLAADTATLWYVEISAPLWVHICAANLCFIF